jgi:hypothetical protein
MILDAVDRWSDNLQAYGMDISTGRVVPFRATQHLDVVGEPLFSIKTGLYW